MTRACFVCKGPVHVGVDDPETYRSYWPPHRGHLPPVVYHTRCVPSGEQLQLAFQALTDMPHDLRKRVLAEVREQEKAAGKLLCRRCSERPSAPNHTWCRPCNNAASKAWRAANPEKVAAQDRRREERRKSAPRPAVRVPVRKVREALYSLNLLQGDRHA